MKKSIAALLLCSLPVSSAFATSQLYHDPPPPFFQPYEFVLLIIMGLVIIHLYSSFITRHIYKENNRQGGYAWGLLLGLIGIAAAAVKTKTSSSGHSC